MPNTRLFLLHALSSVHVGSGSGLSFIDLPLAREKTTNWPLVPGSGMKGVLSAALNASAKTARDPGDPEREILRAAFGAADDSVSKQANSGALIFSDALLVCFPIRSIFGTFAWTTCPFALSRLARDLTAVGLRPPNVPTVPDSGAALIPAEANASALRQGNGPLYLADGDFNANPDPLASVWGKYLAHLIFAPDDRAKVDFIKRFTILHDDAFSFFTEIGTEVATRIRIDPEKGTVARGQLWTEESLPSESILTGIVFADKVTFGNYNQEALLDLVCQERVIQVGGKATVGKGRANLRFAALPTPAVAMGGA